jgi:hydrogenase nickel incorporation protein HypA/HybF
MHEMALAESVREIAEDVSREHGGASVRLLRLDVGRLAAVEIEALRFGLDVALRGSVAEGAAVEIRSLPGQAWCFGCRRSVELGSLVDACPHCGGTQLQVTGGTEMRVAEVELEPAKGESLCA